MTGTRKEPVPAFSERPDPVGLVDDMLLVVWAMVMPLGLEVAFPFSGDIVLFWETT